MWIITRDLSGGMAERTGVHFRDYNAERCAKADTLPIRLLNDDGGLEYEARATRERILESPEERAFGLPDWAMADAGCTELQYLDNGERHTL